MRNRHRNGGNRTGAPGDPSWRATACCTRHGKEAGNSPWWSARTSASNRLDTPSRWTGSRERRRRPGWRPRPIRTVQPTSAAAHWPPVPARVCHRKAGLSVASHWTASARSARPSQPTAAVVVAVARGAFASRATERYETGTGARTFWAPWISRRLSRRTPFPRPLTWSSNNPPSPQGMVSSLGKIPPCPSGIRYRRRRPPCHHPPRLSRLPQAPTRATAGRNANCSRRQARSP
mmetsp:Transcript_25341/g.63445  ORF Transcript_25341/g.63445 Transcript_25341/m.63445 type:complete len:234 (+) Transcript_25341:509-1210(+)